MALGGYGETEDGAVGVVGVDEGQGGVEGHFIELRVGFIYWLGFQVGQGDDGLTEVGVYRE